MPSKEPHIKAALLLLVFSLNTAVSFACSLGGVFHNFHHHAAATTREAGHHHGKGHHHSSGKHDHHHQQPAGDCCSKNIVEVEKMEKSVSRPIEAPPVVFLTSFVIAFAPAHWLLQPVAENPSYFVRWRPPATIQDLRIVMQSFQI